jgi:multimeric flavodoxin WrbA
MSNNAILIIGSSRLDGNTWGVLEGANKNINFPTIDLAKLDISYFDYNAHNLDDDFIPTIQKMLNYDSIGLVSPVYWYTVSAQMKTFLDRFADLLGPYKELGRQLRGKRLFLLATGTTEENMPNCMDETIRLTAQYLGMEYSGSHYVRVFEDLVFDPESISRAQDFLKSQIKL